MALGDERPIPRCPLHNPISHADMAISDPDCLSQQLDSGALADTLWAESDGWGGRRLSLGFAWHPYPARGDDGCLDGCRISPAYNGCPLFSPGGTEFCRCTLGISDE